MKTFEGRRQLALKGHFLCVSSPSPCSWSLHRSRAHFEAGSQAFRVFSLPVILSSITVTSSRKASQTTTPEASLCRPWHSI